MADNTFYSLRDGYIITPHAIAQYISRWARGTREMDAKRDIQTLFNCLRKDGKTMKGDQIMISDLAPNIRFVFRDSKVCVTVLPPNQLAPVGDVDPFEESDSLGLEEDIPVKDSLYLAEAINDKDKNVLLLKELELEEEAIKRTRDELKKRQAALGLDIDKIRAQIGRVRSKLRVAGMLQSE